MIRNIKSRWTMKKIPKSFTDKVTGETVQYWIDCYGDEWMAVNKWGFRVKGRTEKEKQLYRDIENAIIEWGLDGTKTAGTLTRKILKLIENK